METALPMGLKKMTNFADVSDPIKPADTTSVHDPASNTRGAAPNRLTCVPPSQPSSRCLFTRRRKQGESPHCAAHLGVCACGKVFPLEIRDPLTEPPRYGWSVAH